jgi:hypothetical protein
VPTSPGGLLVDEYQSNVAALDDLGIVRVVRLESGEVLAERDLLADLALAPVEGEVRATLARIRIPPGAGALSAVTSDGRLVAQAFSWRIEFDAQLQRSVLPVFETPTEVLLDPERRPVGAYSAQIRDAANVAVAAQLADGRIVYLHREVTENAFSGEIESSETPLFGKVWYEGYPEPEYVWQSTGGTDDFESKFSLTPLIVRHAQGHVLRDAVRHAARRARRAVHLAVRAPVDQGYVKPTVEIMAALPSVVLGFLAGLWLAPMVEKHLVPAVFLLAFVLMPLLGTRRRVLLWSRLPPAARALRPGAPRSPLPVPLRLAAGCASRSAGLGRGLAVRRRLPELAARRDRPDATTSATRWWSAWRWASR